MEKTPRYVVSSYVSNHARVSAQGWYKVVDTWTKKTVEKGFRTSTAAVNYAMRMNEVNR